MATSRPGFTRADTDLKDGSIELQSRGGSSGKAAHTHEIQETDIKDGTMYDTKPDHSSEEEALPNYEDAGDGFAKVTGPVETAKDLVTQVVHVDDPNPDDNPYTFRVFFIGTGLSICKHTQQLHPDLRSG